ncbi:MAG: WGR domain-containing protein [Bacteroidota bacterium]
MSTLRHIRLAFQQGTSDKVYEVDLREVDGGVEVVARYGRRGASLREEVKTKTPVSRAEADALFDRLVQSKTKKGYAEVPALRSAPEPKERRPIDPEARAAAILARLDAARRDPEAETDWPTDRVIWRAGELRLAEAAPAILDLARADVPEDAAAMRLYSSLWALGRIGPAAPNRAEAYAFAVATGGTEAQPAHVRRIAREAALHLATADARASTLEALRGDLPEAAQQALANPEAQTALLDRFLEAATPADLASLEALYQLALDDADARAIVLDAARALPLAAPFFFWIRHLYKTALFREDPELFGLLAHRFATEASGLGDFETGYTWTYDDGRSRTVYLDVGPSSTRGRYAYRRTTTEYAHGDWQNRTTRVETQVRTPDGPTWVAADALSDDEARETAALGYTPKTRAYLRRRAWRTLRRLGEAGADAYVPMVVGALLAFTDEDAHEPRTVVYDWYEWETRTMRSRTTHYPAFAPHLTLGHLLYAGSPRVHLKKSNRAWSFREGVAPDTLPSGREEAFPELWDARPEGLMHLLAESRYAPVHAFAVRALRDNPAFLDRLGADDVRLLLGKPYPETIGLGLDLATRLYDASAPDRALVEALLAAELAEARALALGWIGDQPQAFFDAAFAATLLLHPHADVRQGARALLAEADLPGLDPEAVVGRVLAALLAPDATADPDCVRDAGDALLALYPEAVARLSLGAIEDLVRHEAPAVQALGGRLLGHHPTPPEALPGALIAALMTAGDADVRAEGMALFGRLPDAVLLEQPETLEALALSPLADVRAAVRPVVLRLGAGDAAFARTLAEAVLPVLFRTEKIEGLHADLLALLADDAFAPVRAAFDRDRLWGLLHANHAPAQALGARMLAERDWAETLTIRQITRLASHEVAAVREAAWAMVERQPDRMRQNPIDALTLLDADWDDARAFAVGYVRRTFGADVWTPDLLVHVVDSTRPDVQAFGQELIAQFFDDGDGPTYLLKLSEHPATGVQAFASDYLEAYAGGHLDRLRALVPYVRAVLGQVNRGRVAKDRVLAFLAREATQSPEAAAVVAPLLAHHSATIAVGDKATLVEAMRDLQDAQPGLDLPLERVPVPSPHEVSDAV